MFSNYIGEIERKVSYLNSKSMDIETILDKARNGNILTVGELDALLRIDPEEDPLNYMRILDTSREMMEEIYNGIVFSIVPVYVSSFCREHCKYCNYRAENRDKMVRRIRLSSDQLMREAEYLVVDKGLRVIELVYASDPQIVPEIPNHIRIAHEILAKVGGGIVGLNAEPFDAEEYCILREAGLDFAVLWQETYQREYYRQLHAHKTSKSDFDYRLNSFDRMIESGIENIGLGVLSGLAPWRKDWLLLMEHERFLYNEYGIRVSILGVPRLKPAVGALVQSTQFIPSDEEFLLAIAVHNIFSPETLPFVNTREKFSLCVQQAIGGGALFTFNCSTIPGGYTLGERGYQFPTYDFDVDEYLPRIQLEGLSSIFDWRFDKQCVPKVLY